MTDHDAHEHRFAEVTPAVGGPAPQHLGIDDLMTVRLNVSVEIGSAKLLVREILGLKAGTVIPLNKIAGDLADVLCNGLPFGKGEVVVIGDMLHTRIAEISGANELDDAPA